MTPMTQLKTEFTNLKKEGYPSSVIELQKHPYSDKEKIVLLNEAFLGITIDLESTKSVKPKS